MSKADVILNRLTEKELRDYAQFFEKNQLESLEIVENGVSFVLERKKADLSPTPADKPPDRGVDERQETLASTHSQAESKEEKDKSLYHKITSPMPGTFFISSQPRGRTVCQNGRCSRCGYECVHCRGNEGDE